jgi:hypothetical protein
VLLIGKKDTFKIVVINRVSGEHIIAGEYLNLAEARKALKDEKRKWKSGLVVVVLAYPVSREREVEEDQKKLAESRKPKRRAKSSKSLSVNIEFYFMPDARARKGVTARQSRAAQKGKGRGSS